MTIYESSVPQMKKMLLGLDRWLDTAVAYAQKKSFDPNVLLGLRLAPDMYPLVRQIQAACDSAKFTAARLTGKEAPKHPDTEQTIDEIRARIRSCVSYLDTFTAGDFEGAETRKVDLPFLEGKYAVGSDYLSEMGLPNFYFHVSMAYAILRHNGVDLGKIDYIGSLPTQEG